MTFPPQCDCLFGRFDVSDLSHGECVRDLCVLTRMIVNQNQGLSEGRWRIKIEEKLDPL